MEIRRLSDIFLYQESRYKKKIALAVKKGLGWRTYSTEECLTQILRVCSGLLDIGMSKGDQLILISQRGSPAWTFIDLACMQLGIVVVPVDTAFSARQIEQVFTETGARCYMIEGREYQERIESIRKPRHGYSFSRLPDLPHWSELSIEPMARHLAQIEGLKAAVHEDDLASIIYTAYGEDSVRGVMLSHKNILATVKAVHDLGIFNCDKNVISLQPMHQLFERILLYAYIVAGASVYFKDSKETLLQNLKYIKPHFMGANPEVLEEIYYLLRGETGKKGKFRNAMFSWAVNIGKQYKGKRRISPLYWLKLKIAELFVFRSWRRMLGKRLEGVILETSLFGSHLSRLLSAAGIEVLECFGKAELSGILSMNSIETIKSHQISCGLPVDGLTVRINKLGDTEIGDIYVRGNGVMLGYYNRPEMTAEHISEEGWLHTGKKGKMINGKYLMLLSDTAEKP